MKCWRRALPAALVALVSASEVLKETLSEAECKTVVKKVKKEGKYTEESIQPICNQEVKSSKCDFFSEALALASSHNDFDSNKFCKDIAEAHFCSSTMDHVLSSAPVSDLAFGECMRTHDTKGQAYCLKFEKMLAYAVQNDDLDTMRACYMIEAYEDFGAAPDAQKPSAPAAPKKAAPPAKAPTPEEARIINGSRTELESAGVGSKPTTTTTPEPGRIVGQSGIVVKPKPLDSIGEGKANKSHTFSSNVSEAVPSNETEEPIITEPEPVSNIAVAVRKTKTKTHLKILGKGGSTPKLVPHSAVSAVAMRSHQHVTKAKKVKVATKVQKTKPSAAKSTSSSQKPAAAVALHKRIVQGKQVPTKAATDAAGAVSVHRAGLATVHRTVKQKAKEVSGSSIAKKTVSKAGKQESKDYGGFLSGFVQ
jgi:hypothetical protein